jgi:hypothetical protein
MNTPGPITAGFFAAIGRIVMRLPVVTSYVPASPTNGPHTAREDQENGKQDFSHVTTPLGGSSHAIADVESPFCIFVCRVQSLASLLHGVTPNDGATTDRRIAEPTCEEDRDFADRRQNPPTL